MVENVFLSESNHRRLLLSPGGKIFSTFIGDILVKLTQIVSA